MSVHIKRSDFEKALEGWEAMSERLKAESENQQGIYNRMALSGWVGQTATDTFIMADKFLTEGPMMQSRNLADGICKIMNEAIPRMNALMRRCENLVQ